MSYVYMDRKYPILGYELSNDLSMFYFRFIPYGTKQPLGRIRRTIQNLNRRFG